MDRPTVAAELTGEVAVPDRQELRLALVMTGGVSLAVWMGGATREIDRLQRREGAYAELLDLTGTDPIVDVISGSSAGGINGALLALAQARGNSTGLLRDLWLNDADVGELFRSPLEGDPPSLMKGDELFLPALERAFRQLDQPGPGRTASGAAVDPSRPAPPPLHLIITGSLLRGTLTPFVDDFGTVMQDRDHKARFEFRRGSMKHHLKGLPDPQGGGTKAPFECRHFDAWKHRDDFAERETWRRLALASRSTASFPIAFEPSRCPVDDPAQGSRPDMRCHASFNRTAFVVDGGVLVNKPLEPAIEAIFEITAERQVRRVLAYVVPDPAQSTSAAGDEPVPTMVKTLIDSLITLPRNESIGRELAELSEQNRRARMLRRARMTWLQGGDLMGRADELLDEYREARAEVSIDAVLNSLERGAAREVRSVDLRDWDRAKLRDALLPERLDVLPTALPDETWSATTSDWHWGLQPVEDACLVVMDLLRRGLAITRADPVDGTPEAWSISLLRTARARLYRDLDAYRSFAAERDAPYWQRQARNAMEALKDARFRRSGGRDGDPLRMWARRAFERWPRLINTRPVVELGVDAARILRWSAPALRLLVERARTDPQLPGGVQKDARDLRSMLDALDASPVVPSDTGRLSSLLTMLEQCPTGLPERRADSRVLRNLLAAHVLEVVLAPHERGIEQAVELIQISSDSPNRLGRQLLPREKLAGIQLGHFGAFYKRSWRANDWMWGRIDAAYRLAQVLLDPARLRQRGLAPDRAAQVVETVAFGDEAYADAFEGSLEDRRRAIRAELAYLGDAKLPTPRDLPACVDAIAARIQLEIIQDELPVVASSVRYDMDHDGTAHVSRAVAFADRYDSLEREGTLTPRAARELFAECHVGAESFMDERHSDKFARTVGDAAGIAVSAARGGRSGLPAPIRGMLTSLRGVTLSLWILARSAVQPGLAATAFTTALLAIGGALLAVAMLAEAPTFFLAVGSALLAAGLFVASIRVGVGWVAGVVVLGLLFVLLPLIATWLLRMIDPASGTSLASFEGWLDDNLRIVSQVFLIVGLVAGSMVLGLVKRSKPVGPPSKRQQDR